MEYLDIYDEQGNHLGVETRKKVHSDALWHKTVHCWLYDKDGSVYFQIRKDSNTFYTTASGHVSAGESVKEAFGREIKEEIGIDIDYSDAVLVGIVPWRMDKKNKDGTWFKDRAFSNVYVDEFEGTIDDFHFDPDEVSGLAKVNAKEVIQLFQDKKDTILAEMITTENGKNISTKKEVNIKDFLVNAHETAMDKYKDVLNKIIELTK